MVFTWEQVSKCQFHQFIFHVRIEMSRPSIMSTQSFQNRIYFSPCENICTSYFFTLVCANERSAFGQCQQLKRKTASLALTENSKQVNWQIISERWLDFASEQKWVNNVMNCGHNGKEMQINFFMLLHWCILIRYFNELWERRGIRRRVSWVFDWWCKNLKPLEQLGGKKNIDSEINHNYDSINEY